MAANLMNILEVVWFIENLPKMCPFFQQWLFLNDFNMLDLTSSCRVNGINLVFHYITSSVIINNSYK